MTIAGGATWDVIVVGGGVAGASTAMQLGIRGRRVLVVERERLGNGSTGRAAGLLGQLRSSRGATKILVDGVEIVRQLEERTDRDIYVQTGSLRVASTAERAAEVEHHVELGRTAGLAVHRIDKAEVADLVPYMRVDDLVAACYCPTDGHLQPADLHDAFVAVARQHGVEFRQHAPVRRVLSQEGRVMGVSLDDGDVHAPVVVNAAGPWSYTVADHASTRLPSAALEHFYLTTEINDAAVVDRLSPAVRDRELRIYSRPESGGLIVGMYGAVAVVRETERLPDDFDMSAMQPERDEADVARLVDVASRRFPFITPETPMKLTHGIMTFSPDCRPFCGPDRDIEGLYHCAGFSGHGIAQSPTVGLIMTQLILDGETPYDVDALAADRYFDEADLETRDQVESRCAQAYREYYGKVVISGE